MKLIKRFLTVVMTLALLGGIIMPAVLTHAAATNLITNPSVETASTSNASLPSGWLEGGWGTNNASFSYPTTGHTGGRSVEVQMNSYTSGDAKWYFSPVAVTAGSSYVYSDFYQSSVPTELVAQYQTSSGALSYQDFGSTPASTAWTQYSHTLTVPTGITQMTVFHLIQSVGTLQTDDFSLSAAPAVTIPTVSITTPTANASLSGTVTVNANASDTSGIKQVQFSLDGQPLGSPVTASPYQYSWNTASTANGTHSLTATATNTNGTIATSAPISVVVANSVPAGTNLIANPSFETAGSTGLPSGWLEGNWGTNTTAFSYPSTGAHTGTRSGQIQMTSYTSGDAKWYFNPVPVTAGATYNFSDYYQSSVATDVMAVFMTSNGTTTYKDLGAAPASASAWKQYTASIVIPAGTQTMTVYHLISAVGTLHVDDFSLAAATVAPPSSVSITAPAASATVSGNVTVSASATDSSGVKNVQFQLDGKALGSPVTASPYQTSWNTATATNGTHSLTASETNSSGKTITSAAVSVTVNNQTATSNEIPNPSLETVNPANSNLPLDWNSSSWGTNTSTFSYLNTGHTGKRSVKAQITSYTSGAAYWYDNDQPITGAQMYDFSDYYESNIGNEIDAAVTMSDGSVQYVYLGEAFPSPNSWTKFDTQFTAPAGAVSVNIEHNIFAVGYLTTDDFSLTPFSYQGLSRPIISITDDDSYASFYTNGLPVLQKYGLNSTDYIITSYIDNVSGYMSSAQVKGLYAAGQEIGSHSVDHPDLTTLTAAQQDAELKNSQTFLQNLIGVPVTDYAAPYGSVNAQVLADADKYYKSYRGVEAGYNAKNNFDPNNILVQNLDDTTTLADVQSWITEAQATNTWLVLVYHQVDPDSAAGLYNTYPSDFDAQMAAVKASGIPVETVSQALQEVESQVK